jgi:hypothetical protein
MLVEYEVLLFGGVRERCLVVDLDMCVGWLLLDLRLNLSLSLGLRRQASTSSCHVVVVVVRAVIVDGSIKRLLVLLLWDSAIRNWGLIASKKRRGVVGSALAVRASEKRWLWLIRVVEGVRERWEGGKVWGTRPVRALRVCHVLLH